MAARPKTYLAGPTVFLPDHDAIFETMKSICARHGLEGCSPLDNQIGLEGLSPGKATITEIVKADFALMRAADAALVCLDPFRRSTEMDPGTAVEIGFLYALQKPMSAWTQDPRSYPDKVSEFFAAESMTKAIANTSGGTSGDMRDPDHVLVHSEGCVANGMAHIGVELSGGIVFCHKNWLIAFEAAAMHLAQEQLKLPPRESECPENHNFLPLAG
jgi:nucleoside 2-deoxyribosyltransferase